MEDLLSIRMIHSLLKTKDCSVIVNWRKYVKLDSLSSTRLITRNRFGCELASRPSIPVFQVFSKEFSVEFFNKFVNILVFVI